MVFISFINFSNKCNVKLIINKMSNKYSKFLGLSVGRCCVVTFWILWNMFKHGRGIHSAAFSDDSEIFVTSTCPAQNNSDWAVQICNVDIWDYHVHKANRGQWAPACFTARVHWTCKNVQNRYQKNVKEKKCSVLFFVLFYWNTWISPKSTTLCESRLGLGLGL